MKICRLLITAVSFAHLSACQATLPTKLLPAQHSKTLNQTIFKMKSCMITTERKAVCKLSVVSNYRDRIVSLAGNVSIQDNYGVDYSVSGGGFGDSSGKLKRSQIAVADQPYDLTLIAENISTRATFVRAVIFHRIDLAFGPRQHIATHKQIIFSKPIMIELSKQSSISESPVTSHITNDKQPVNAAVTDSWEIVGLWNYDEHDGQHLGQGYVLRNKAGAGAGKSWKSHLELKNHQTLTPRQRTLWPVTINSKLRKVCANYSGYPTYHVHIDLPGEVNDGIYVVENCTDSV